MILAGFIAGLTVLIGLLLAGGVFFYVQKRRIIELVRNFISNPSPGDPSPFALLCESVAGIFGAALSRSLKATFMGIESSESKGINKQRAEATIAGSPMLAALVAGFPNLAKKFINNPAMASLADLALKKITMVPKPGVAAPDNGHAVRFRF